MENQNVKEKVISLITEVTGIPEESVAEDEKLSRLGVDSLAALEIVAQIERFYRIEVPEEEIPKVKTLRDLLNAVSAKLCVTV